MYKIFLDDYRNPRDVFPTTNNSEWDIVRSFNAFVQIISQRGLPFFISFDHDLSDEHYPTRDTFGKEIDYTKHEKTGYHAALWLIDFCLQNKLIPPLYHVHSANPVGRENIARLLKNWDRTKRIYENSETSSTSECPGDQESI